MRRRYRLPHGREGALASAAEAPRDGAKRFCDTTGRAVIPYVAAMMPRLLLKMMLVSMLMPLGACTTSDHEASSTPTTTAAPQATLASVNFCVGTSRAHPASEAGLVHIEWQRGGKTLADSENGLLTRVSVDITPGPFVVKVDGVQQMSGEATVGSPVGGSSGTGCPPSS
jgi:hypothetical protein